MKSSKAILVVLFAVAIVQATTAVKLWSGIHLDSGSGHMHLDSGHLEGESAGWALSGTLGKRLLALNRDGLLISQLSSSSSSVEGGGDDYLVTYKMLNTDETLATLRISPSSTSKSRPDSSIVCNTFEWSSTSPAIEDFEDCFQYGENAWYGGAESRLQQHWPINSMSYPTHAPYLTGLFDSWASVIERYWLISSGVAIIVDPATPLFVQMNNGSSICFLSTASYPYPPSGASPVTLRYDVCQIEARAAPASYLNQLQLHVMNAYFARPTHWPDELMFKSPIWSTWAVYKANINDEVVVDFASQVIANNFTHAQLEIDDKWQTAYGDFTFDKRKFASIATTIAKLNAMGFRTTLWVHPFFNIESYNFAKSAEDGYVVRMPGGDHAGVTAWWDGLLASILDTTNPNATKWFVAELDAIKQQTGINAFKFDAGEVNWLPRLFDLFNCSISPDDYSSGYARMASQLGSMIEVRVGSRTQDLPIFVRMLDKDSTWGFDNGLKSVLTTALVFSVLGYPFILPDMIGGNAYSFSTFWFGGGGVQTYPEPELYVRWAQMTAFLPSMQFSIPPWLYDDESKVASNGIPVNAICKKLVALHETLVFPVVLKEANNSVQLGTPIIRPMWWVDNSDARTLRCDDQFMVGDDILVAPITDPSTYQRDIYLPKGSWKSENGTIFHGPMLIKDYPAPIETIPYFVSC